MIASRDVESVFNHLFESSLNTVLIGGADEPVYYPAQKTENNIAQIHYREDYISSALHECQPPLTRLT